MTGELSALRFSLRRGRGISSTESSASVSRLFEAFRFDFRVDLVFEIWVGLVTITPTSAGACRFLWELGTTMSSSEDSSFACFERCAFARCEMEGIFTTTRGWASIHCSSSVGASADRSGDLARLDALDGFEVLDDFFIGSSDLLLQDVSGRTAARLGCPYESLAKRSWTSSLASPEGDAAEGANASRVCFFWDLRGMTEEVRVEGSIDLDRILRR